MKKYCYRACEPNSRYEIEILKIKLRQTEVRVREETAREIFDWFDKKATLENNFIILEDKIKTFKKRFLVKNEVQKE